jgi:hypothetical protein
MSGHAWWHPSRLLSEALGVAIVGILSQVVAPTIIPSVQLWLYDKTAFDFAGPRFLVLASRDDLAGDPTKADAEFNRVFCGFTLPADKICLMHRLVPDAAIAPTKWPLDKSPVKTVLLGAAGSTQVFIAWVSERSGAGGAAVAPDFGNGSFVGYGFACTKQTVADEGRPNPIKVLFGNLPAEIAIEQPSSLEAIRGAVANLIQRSNTNLEISKGPVCSTPAK